MRIGIGFDIHPLTEGRKLILGGVEMPYIKGLDGFSDADVLIHSICDALLGAIGKGDIGEHFPDTDITYKDIASAYLLKQVLSMVDEAGWSINNIDTVIMAEEPKLAPFKEKMKDSLALFLKIKKEDINIKCSTHEGMDSIGRGEAIAVWTVALLTEKKVASD